MTTNDQKPQDATPAEIDAHNYSVARDTALRLLVVGLADATPERDRAMDEMTIALMEGGPMPTARALGAITACAVTALAAHHGSREAAIDALLAALAENHGGQLLCPLDCIPCPNPRLCVMQSACQPPKPSDSPA